jgi:hypothetical protein
MSLDRKARRLLSRSEGKLVDRNQEVEPKVLLLTYAVYIHI